MFYFCFMKVLRIYDTAVTFLLVKYLRGCIVIMIIYVQMHCYLRRK